MSKFQQGNVLPGLDWFIGPDFAGRMQIPDGMTFRVVHKKSNKIVKQIRLSYRKQGQVPVNEINKILKIVKAHLEPFDWTQKIDVMVAMNPNRDSPINAAMQALDKATKDFAGKIEKKIIEENLTHHPIKNGYYTLGDKVVQIVSLSSHWATYREIDKHGKHVPPNYKRMGTDVLHPDNFDADNFVGMKLDEDAAANSVGSGNVAGIADPDVGYAKKKKDDEDELDEETHFAGSKVFEVDSDTFHKSIKGKKKFARFKKHMSLEDYETVGEDIRSYAKNNPKKDIILKDKASGRMLYLRGKIHDSHR